MTGTSRSRRGLAALLTAVAALALAGTATPAQAAGYRYWSFWEGAGGAWRFAPTGPSTATPANGDVEGWRFAVSPDSASAVQPRGAAEFGAICAGTPAKAGSERIALVLDFGTPADAPGGAVPPAERTACALVPTGASAADALVAVSKSLRYDSSGLLCGVDGYPATGCGEQVSTSGTKPAAAPAPAKSDAAGPAVGTLAGAGAIVVLGAAGLWQARRRRRREVEQN